MTMSMSALYGYHAVSLTHRYAARATRTAATRPAIAAGWPREALSFLTWGRTDSSEGRLMSRAARTIAVTARANPIVTAAYETGTPSCWNTSGAAKVRIVAGRARRVRTTV